MAICKVLVALALVTTVMCDVMDREMYDDTPGDMELMYPEQNYVDMMPNPDPPLPSRGEPLLQPTSEPRKYENTDMHKIILYKMLTALRNHDASPSFLPVPKWIATGTVLVPPDTFNYSPLKRTMGSMLKRLSPDEASKRINSNMRPQRKWKIKKGKTGSPMICYFKLCAFRPSI